MRTVVAAPLLALAVAASACLVPTEPADPHPACAQVDVGSSVNVTSTLAVDLGGKLVQLPHCTATFAPGVKASGFDTEASLACNDDVHTVALATTVTFADFRSASARTIVDARSGAVLRVSSAGHSYSGTVADRATLTIESLAGAPNGDDVSSNYELRGVLHFPITKATVLQDQSLSATVQPSTLDVPFTWTPAAFSVDTGRCPQ